MAEDTHGIDFIDDYFRGKDDGFLVDVGAHDGIAAGSMTRGLVARGWGGVMVEPLKEAFAKLRKAYRANGRITCMNVACSDKEGTADLYPCRGVSTLNKAWAKACDDYWKHVKYGKAYKVPVLTLAQILRSQREVGRCGARIDYLQIDTEGHDLHVLKGMDWSFQPSVVCVETLDMVNRNRRGPGGKWQPNPAMNVYLREHGYALALLTRGGNGIYVRSGS